MPSLVILVSAVLVLSCGQTEAHDRYTHATTVGVSKDVRWTVVVSGYCRCNFDEFDDFRVGY